MYQNYFQLNQRPFSATPDPNALYSAPSMRLALSALEQTLRDGEGIGLLTAPAGTGKTLACKVLAERLANDPLPVLLLNSAYATRSSLLQAILFELGRPYARMSEQELRLELVSCGRRIAESQTGMALIVDEAHLLGEHIIEELRALTNFLYATRPVFRVVLSGQLPLEDLLAKRSLEAVNQRLKCHVTLDLLNQQESLEYIMTRIEQAGGRLLNVFTESALELIIHAADGLPRCLNQLCDHACLLASVTASGPVTPQHVHEALEDLQKLPLHWNIPLPTRDPLTELRGGKPESFHDENKSAVISVNRADLAPSAKTPGELAPATSVIEIGAELSQGTRLPREEQFSLEDEQILIETEPDEAQLPDAIETAQSQTAPDASALEATHPEPEELLPALPAAESTAPPSPPAVAPKPAEKQFPAVQPPESEIIQDRYAQLDALRHGQIERPGQPVLAAPEAPACTPVVDEIEERIAQTILEIAEELSGSNGTGLEDSFPSPDELMQRAIDSASARNDVVHPASDTNDTGDYERLYGELRRKQSEG